MCLLTFLAASTQPDTDALHIGAAANDDGHGFAIVAGDRLDELIVHRGMNAKDVIAAFTTARAAHPAGPALFHSRLATHGNTNVDNCHPFVVGGDCRTVLAHNGVLPQAVQPRKGDRRSDTRIAAEDFIPAFGSLRARRTRLKLARWMTTDNKMVILTVDRRFNQRAYILNEQSGIWDGGIWYSNTGYRPYISHFGLDDDRFDDAWYHQYDADDEAGSRGERWDWQRVLDRCGNCDAIIDVRDGECPWCGWCLDCGQLPDLCLCYTPAQLDRLGLDRITQDSSRR
jgi:predicted glutamine amidotransferase